MFQIMLIGKTDILNTILNILNHLLFKYNESYFLEVSGHNSRLITENGMHVSFA